MATPPSQAQPSLNYTQPQASAGQTQPGYSQMPPSTGQMPSGQMQSGAGSTPQQPATPAASAASPSAAAAAMPSNANPQVREAQQRLQAAGLYNGPVDGVMDPDTRAALARYQQQNGLQRTSSLDEPTLARLMSSQTTGSGSTTQSAPTAAPTGAATMNPQSPPMEAGGNNAGKATAR